MYYREVTLVINALTFRKKGYKSLKMADSTALSGLKKWVNDVLSEKCVYLRKRKDMEKIIGRIEEQSLLRKRINSDSAELIALYGRRRVGKTFLVKQLFGGNFSFYFTGIFQGSKDEQLKEFTRQLEHYGSRHRDRRPKDWFDAFALLREHLETLPKDRPLIVFLDELPWMDSPKSRFMKAFEFFWNSWGSTNDKLKLIVCGSATTWMRNNLISDKGGLYNRTTCNIYLPPFSLSEVEQYLVSRGVEWNRLQTAECYMILGGIPQYLSYIERGLSLSQNVDKLFFTQNALLRNEYDFLFRSLFKEDSLCRQIVEILAKKAAGMTRKEIREGLRINDSGLLTEALRDLTDCDFIRQYSAFGKRERDTLFQLTDLFSLFHLRHVATYRGQDENHWQNLLDSPSRRAWCDYSFEQLCLHHIGQIKRKLGISGVQSDIFSWRSEGAQIDLLIDRRDQVINLCEMKFSQGLYEITRQYDEHLRERRETFRSKTKTRKALHLSFVTTYGVKEGLYKGNIQSEITLDDLFV